MIIDRIQPRNDVNIFVDGGAPEHVAYPSSRLADGLVREGAKRLDGFVRFADQNMLIAKARFDLISVNKSAVFLPNMNQRIQTAALYLSNGWY